jgi:hypothetical protein
LPGANGMRRVVMILGLALTVGAASSLLLVPTSAKAVKGKDATFLIPLSEGYGVAECLDGQGECGRVVADGWCEANGYSRAASFGQVAKDEVTGSIDAAQRTEPALAITCEE